MKLSDQSKIEIQDLLTKLLIHEIMICNKLLRISPENPPTEEHLQIVAEAIKGAFAVIYPKDALYDLIISTNDNKITAEFAMDFKVIEKFLEVKSAIYYEEYAANTNYLS